MSLRFWLVLSILSVLEWQALLWRYPPVGQFNGAGPAAHRPAFRTVFQAPVAAVDPCGQTP